MSICTECGGNYLSLNVATWQDVAESASSFSNAVASRFGLICSDCLDALDHRQSCGEVDVITACAVSIDAAEILSDWIGGGACLPTK